MIEYGLTGIEQYYYDRENNWFIDAGGFVVFNIFLIITPVTLFVFKHQKEYMLVTSMTGELVELIWPDDDEN